MGNQSAREALSRAAERPISEEEYSAVKDRLVGLGLIVKGRGRGGSIALAEGIEKYEMDAGYEQDSRKSHLPQEEETRYSDAILDCLTNACMELAGLQKTLRHFREFREEEKKALELCVSIQSKINNQLIKRQTEKMSGMFY